MVNQMVKYSSRTLNRTFAALADPTRRQILAHLARGDRRVTDLARPHNMSLPAVSKHLRVLENAGLLRRRRYGRVHEMRLERRAIKKSRAMGRGVSKVLGGMARSVGGLLGKDEPARQQKKKGLTHVPGVHREHRCSGDDIERRSGSHCVREHSNRRQPKEEGRQNESNRVEITSKSGVTRSGRLRASNFSRKRRN